MEIWIVGKINEEDYGQWEFQGVYDDIEKAIAICEDEDWFVGPAEMNEAFPPKSIDWPGIFYPKVQTEP